MQKSRSFVDCAYSCQTSWTDLMELSRFLCTNEPNPKTCCLTLLFWMERKKTKLFFCHIWKNSIRRPTIWKYGILFQLFDIKKLAVSDKNWHFVILNDVNQNCFLSTKNWGSAWEKRKKRNMLLILLLIDTLSSLVVFWRFPAIPVYFDRLHYVNQKSAQTLFDTQFLFDLIPISYGSEMGLFEDFPEAHGMSTNWELSWQSLFAANPWVDFTIWPDELAHQCSPIRVWLKVQHQYSEVKKDNISSFCRIDKTTFKYNWALRFIADWIGNATWSEGGKAEKSQLMNGWPVFARSGRSKLLTMTKVHKKQYLETGNIGANKNLMSKKKCTHLRQDKHERIFLKSVQIIYDLMCIWQN